VLGWVSDVRAAQIAHGCLCQIGECLDRGRLLSTPTISGSVPDPLKRLGPFDIPKTGC
jgi:hypothetical protein